MAGSLNGIDGVERVFPKLLSEVHEVTLDKLDLILKTQVLGVLGRTTNLESVVVQTDDVDVNEPGDFTRGATNTAADIENAHAGFETHLGGEVVLVTGERSVEGFALVESRKVE